MWLAFVRFQVPRLPTGPLDSCRGNPLRHLLLGVVTTTLREVPIRLETLRLG